MGCLSLLVGALALTTTMARAPPNKLAPVCSTQRRASNAPYQVGLISETLNTLFSRSKKGSICAGAFPSLPNGTAGHTIRRSNGSLVLDATRHAQLASLGQECVDAFDAIIYSCIEQIAYWGGSITIGNVDYTISNDAYPKNWIPESSPPPPAPKQPAPKKPAPVPSSPKKAAPEAAAKKPSSSPLASISQPPLLVHSTTKSALSSSRSAGSHGSSGAAARGGAGAAVGGAAIIAAGTGAAAAAGGAGAVAPAADAAAAPAGHSAAGHNQDPAQNSHELTTTRHSTHTATPSSSHRPSSSSTAPPLPLASNRLVLPRSSNDAANAQLTTKMKDELGAVLEIANPKSGVVAWSVAMTEVNVREYLQNPLVS